MNDDLQTRLANWEAPAEPPHAAHRIAALLADPNLPGPFAAEPRQGVRALWPIAGSIAVAGLLWAGWLVAADRPPRVLQEGLDVPRRIADTREPLSVANRDVARYVSQVDLDGFDVVTAPSLQIERSTP